MKNTLDCFLEECYFRSSAIVSYSPETFGGINAAQQRRVHQAFDEDGKIVDGAYDKGVLKFLDLPV